MAPKRKQNRSKRPGGTPDPQAAVDISDAADTNPEDLKAKANECIAAGQHAQAMQLLTKAIECGPENPHLYHSNRSLCALTLKQYQLAVDDANRCIEHQPTWVKGYSRLGAALFYSGKANEAAKAYAAGLVHEPTNELLLQGLQSVNAAIKQPKPAAPPGQNPDPPAPAAAPDSKRQNAGQGPVVGIDLGTTYSCVAVYMPSASRVEVIPNEEGSRTTP